MRTPFLLWTLPRLLYALFMCMSVQLCMWFTLYYITHLYACMHTHSFPLLLCISLSLSPDPFLCNKSYHLLQLCVCDKVIRDYNCLRRVVWSEGGPPVKGWCRIKVDDTVVGCRRQTHGGWQWRRCDRTWKGGTTLASWAWNPSSFSTRSKTWKRVRFLLLLLFWWAGYSVSCLFPCKLSIWLSCGTVLTGAVV